MRTNSLLFTVSVVCSLGFGASQALAQAQDICPAVTQLMNAAERDFPDLRGSQWRSSSGTMIPAYDARITILNGTCEVHDPEPQEQDEVSVYFCGWVHNDAQGTIAFAQALSDAVRACVRRSPTVDRTRLNSRRTEHLLHRYSLPARQRDAITVSVSAVSRTREDATVHETILQISATKELR